MNNEHRLPHYPFDKNKAIANLRMDLEERRIPRLAAVKNRLPRAIASLDSRHLRYRWRSDVVKVGWLVRVDLAGTEEPQSSVKARGGNAIATERYSERGF